MDSVKLAQDLTAMLIALLGAVLPILHAMKSKDREEADRAKLHAATKAAYIIASEVAKRTQTKIDDGVALVLGIVEQEFSQARGRALTEKERGEVRAKALTMSADPSKPGSLGELDDDTIKALAPHYLPPQAKQRIAE